MEADRGELITSVADKQRQLLVLLRTEGEQADELVQAQRSVLAERDPQACLAELVHLDERLLHEGRRRCDRALRHESSLTFAARVHGPSIGVGMQKVASRAATIRHLRFVDDQRAALCIEAATVLERCCVPITKRIGALRRRLHASRAKADAANITVSGYAMKGRSSQHHLFTIVKADQSEVLALERKLRHLTTIGLRTFLAPTWTAAGEGAAASALDASRTLCPPDSLQRQLEAQAKLETTARAIEAMAMGEAAPVCGTTRPSHTAASSTFSCTASDTSSEAATNAAPLRELSAAEIGERRRRASMAAAASSICTVQAAHAEAEAAAVAAKLAAREALLSTQRLLSELACPPRDAQPSKGHAWRGLGAQGDSPEGHQLTAPCALYPVPSRDSPESPVTSPRNHGGLRPAATIQDLQDVANDLADELESLANEAPAAGWTRAAEPEAEDSAVPTVREQPVHQAIPSPATASQAKPSQAEQLVHGAAAAAREEEGACEEGAAAACAAVGHTSGSGAWKWRAAAPCAPMLQSATPASGEVGTPPPPPPPSGNMLNGYVPSGVAEAMGPMLLELHTSMSKLSGHVGGQHGVGEVGAAIGGVAADADQMSCARRNSGERSALARSASASDAVALRRVAAPLAGELRSLKKEPTRRRDLSARDLPPVHGPAHSAARSETARRATAPWTMDHGPWATRATCAPSPGPHSPAAITPAAITPAAITPPAHAPLARTLPPSTVASHHQTAGTLQPTSRLHHSSSRHRPLSASLTATASVPSASACTPSCHRRGYAQRSRPVSATPPSITPAAAAPPAAAPPEASHPPSHPPSRPVLTPLHVSALEHGAGTRSASGDELSNICRPRLKADKASQGKVSQGRFSPAGDELNTICRPRLKVGALKLGSRSKLEGGTPANLEGTGYRAHGAASLEGPAEANANLAAMGRLEATRVRLEATMGRLEALVELNRELELTRGLGSTQEGLDEHRAGREGLQPGAEVVGGLQKQLAVVEVLESEHGEQGGRGVAVGTRRVKLAARCPPPDGAGSRWAWEVGAVPLL